MKTFFSEKNISPQLKGHKTTLPTKGSHRRVGLGVGRYKLKTQTHAHAALKYIFILPAWCRTSCTEILT